jgi:putative Holliday junction resolvase
LQTLLGFDYGTQRIGIAVGQSITRTATAVCTVRSRLGKPDWNRITKLLDIWHPDALVVGLPLHEDASDSDSSKAARKFARQLAARYRLPVHTMDERLSTHAAKQLLNQAGGKQDIDDIAAMLILQNWLETHNV